MEFLLLRTCIVLQFSSVTTILALKINTLHSIVTRKLFSPLSRRIRTKDDYKALPKKDSAENQFARSMIVFEECDRLAGAFPISAPFIVESKTRAYADIQLIIY